MKFLFDLLPVALFFAAYFIAGSIYVATAVIIPATIAQAIFEKWRYGKVNTMLWISLVLVVVMGSLTLFLHDKRFIMWKPTLLYWLFAAALIISNVFMKKNLIRALIGKEITVPDAVWSQLNIAWAVFFAIMGVVNLYVASHFEEQFWVKFKLFGFTGLLMLFVVLQAPFLARHMEHKEGQQEHP
jgi:intracellular septation protein